MFARLVAMLCLLLLASFSVAQEAVTPITAENATQLVPVQTVGSALPGKLAFSPDGRYILASTSEQTFVYQSEQPDAAPKILPFTDFYFDADGRLIADGHYWNLDSGLSVGIAPMTRVIPPTENQPNTLIEVVKRGGETIQIDTGFPYQVVGTAVSEEYGVLAVFMRKTTRAPIQSTLYLYSLSTGLINGIFPQYENSNLEKLFFTAPEATLILEMSSVRGDYNVEIYNAVRGMPAYFAGEINSRGHRSPDGKLVGYAMLDRNEIAVLGNDGLSEFAYTPIDDEYSSVPPYTIGNQYIAIFKNEGRGISITHLSNKEAKSAYLVFDGMPYYSDFYFAQNDRWLVYESSPITYLWDLQRLGNDPVEIKVDNDYLLSINQDLTRYAARISGDAEDGFVVHDVATDEKLAELPLDAIFDATMSQAIYWQAGNVILHDIVRDEILTFPVIDQYLGQVFAFNPIVATAAFVDQQVALANLQTKTVLVVDVPDAPEIVDFTADGETFLVYEEPQRYSEPTTIAFWDTKSGEQITETANYSARAISPAGHYAVSYEVEYSFRSTCIWGYGDGPRLVVYPAPTGSETEAAITVYEACGEHAAVFTRNDELLYIGNGMNVFAFPLNELKEPLFPSMYGEAGTEFSILNYSSADYSEPYEIIRDIFLSPDQSQIAVIVETWENIGFYSPLGIRLEIFDLATLKEGSHRDDIQPIETITGASQAVFSPDGKAIVTDVGLLSLESDNKTEIGDGTISAFTSDSQLLATYQNGYVNLWSVPDASSVTFPLAQYAINGVKELAFSPDNRYQYMVREGDVQMWGVK